MPTLVEICGATYPKEFKAKPILPMEGQSLLPTFADRAEHHPCAPIFWEHEGNRAVHYEHWKLVSRYPGAWELYNMWTDRTEMNDVADKFPDKVKELSELYDRWAERCGVVSPDKLPAARKITPAPLGEGAN